MIFSQVPFYSDVNAVSRSQCTSRSEWLPVSLSQVLMAISPSQLLKTEKIRKEQRKVHSLLLNSVN